MSNNVFRQVCPPILWSSLSIVKAKLRKFRLLNVTSSLTTEHHIPDSQDLDVYWNPEMAESLETWGEGNAWSEIQFLMVNYKGKVLDIACGTGKVIEILSKFSNLEIYGCDISDFLIQKAINRGIPNQYLKVCDATHTDYEDNFFKYAYSIGSLEHFTEEGIQRFISEVYRITTCSSSHMIPVSRSGKDEGWLKTNQSYYNNSVEWWLDKFKSSYKDVYILDSQWEDSISLGKWFICLKNRE
jgi:ubiquinone/menaquinone biosynthesis C-methylase UbiE